MPTKKPIQSEGTLNLRGIPRDTIYRLKMAAAAEHRTVKDLILELVDTKIQDLEKKGLLPKGK
jgi:hypothetical protein